jgi:hypothetical protein
MSRKAGDIVIADWRGGALPREPNRLRSAVVVQGDELFHASFPNLLVVPLANDPELAIPDPRVAISPAARNGRERRCFAL